MTQFSAFLALGMIFLTSCSTQRSFVKEEPKFHEAKDADLVVRYYTDDVNRVLKPLQMEGPFLTTFDKGGVLGLAKQQTGRELAVVILLKFNCSDRVRLDWLSPLTQIGYKRVVFLRAENGTKVEGLPILANPVQLTEQPKAPAAPKEEHSDLAGG